MPPRWQHAFVIGNIKGALSIALALGLPAAVPERSLLVNVAFGVTFVSLLGQGLSLGFVLRKLGLVTRDDFADASGEHQVRLVAARAARLELEALRQSGLVPRAAFEQLQFGGHSRHRLWRTTSRPKSFRSFEPTLVSSPELEFEVR